MSSSTNTIVSSDFTIPVLGDPGDPSVMHCRRFEFSRTTDSDNVRLTPSVGATSGAFTLFRIDADSVNPVLIHTAILTVETAWASTGSTEILVMAADTAELWFTDTQIASTGEADVWKEIGKVYTTDQDINVLITCTGSGTNFFSAGKGSIWVLYTRGQY